MPVNRGEVPLDFFGVAMAHVEPHNPRRVFSSRGVDGAGDDVAGHKFRARVVPLMNRSPSTRNTPPNPRTASLMRNTRPLVSREQSAVG